MLRRAANPSRLVFKFWNCDSTGSNGHAKILQLIVRMFEPGATNIIADSDTAVVCTHWDNLIQRHLQSFGCVATQYDDWDKFPHRGDRIQSYKKSPHFVWAAFSAAYDFSGLDFSDCNTSGKTLIDTTQLSSIYGLPSGQGFFVGHEAGWNTPRYFRDQDIPFKLLTHSRSRSVLGDLPPAHEEYELDDVPFVVHQRSSRKIPYSTGPSKLFYDKVEAWR